MACPNAPIDCPTTPLTHRPTDSHNHAVTHSEINVSSPDTARVPFSLFDGDRVNRAFNFFGLESRRAWHIAGRAALLAGVTWLPMAVLALVTGLRSSRIEATNFFADYAAYAQFLVALPLFVVAPRSRAS